MNTAQDHVAPLVGTVTTLRPTVTLLTTEACHLCEDASVELRQRVDRGQLALEQVAADSASGQALLAQHRPAMFPLVLLDGEFFSAGRLPRRKLDRALTTPKEL